MLLLLLGFLNLSPSLEYAICTPYTQNWPAKRMRIYSYCFSILVTGKAETAILTLLTKSRAGLSTVFQTPLGAGSLRNARTLPLALAANTPDAASQIG